MNLPKLQSPILKDTVHIIESPDAYDLLDGRLEGESLTKILNLSEIDVTYHLVVNKNSLFECFDRLTKMTEIGDRPHLHFSAHGNKDCMVLTSGEELTWQELGEYVYEYNERVFKNSCKDIKYPSVVTICMSVCNGFSASNMVKDGYIPPFYVLIGPQEDVFWSDSLIAFSTFYHHIIIKDLDGINAVSVMNEAAGIDKVFTGIRAIDLYKEK